MLRGSVLIFLGNLYQKFSAFLILVVLWHIFDSRNDPHIGTYQLLVQVGTYVTTIFTLGLGPAHVFFRGQRRLSTRQLWGNSLLAAAVLGLGAIVIFTVLRVTVLGPWLKMDSINPLLLTLVTIAFPMYVLQNFLDFSWQAEGQFGTYTVLYTLRYVTMPLFLLIGALSSEPYVGIAAALLANAIVTLLVSVVVQTKRYGLRAELDARVFRQEVRYGSNILAGSVFTQLGLRFDYFLVNYFLSPAKVAPYGTATNLAEAIWLVPSAVASAILPKLSGLRDHTDAGQVTARVCRLVLALTVVPAVILWVLGHFILLYVFSSGALPALEPLRILLVGTLAFSVQKVLVQYFLGQGQTQWFQRATIISVIVNIVLNVILVPRPEWGINGAAFASAVSYSLSAVILAWLFLRQTGLGVKDLIVPTRADFEDLATKLKNARRRMVASGHRGAA